MSVSKGSSLNEKMDEKDNNQESASQPDNDEINKQVSDENIDEVSSTSNGYIEDVAHEIDVKLIIEEDSAPHTTDIDDFSNDTTSETSVLTIETKEPVQIDNEEIEKLQMAKRRVSLSLPIDENDKFIVTLTSPGVAGVEIDTVGGSERTKKFLESDDAIISQIFSQTITSAGVTPTEDYDFSAGPLPDLITNEALYAAHSDVIDTEEKKSATELDEIEDDAEKDAQMLLESGLHSKQRPSIVIDCYDESQERAFPYYEEPVTPNEEDLKKSFDKFEETDRSNAIKTEVIEETIFVTITDNTAVGGFYFDQTIDCDDEDDVGNAQTPDVIHEADNKSSSESMDITKSGSINEESEDDGGSLVESVVEHFENNETSAITTEKVAKTKKVVRKTTKTTSTTSSTSSAAYQQSSTTLSEITAASADTTVIEKIGKTNGVTSTEMETTSTCNAEITSNGEVMDEDSPKKTPTKLTKKKSDAGGKKKVKKSKKSDEKENISVHVTEGSLTKLLTEKFENITKNADNTENGTLKGCDKNYKNSRFKVIDFLSLQQPYEPKEMAPPTTVMMMTMSPEIDKPQINNFNNHIETGAIQNGNSHYQDSDEMFDLDIVDHSPQSDDDDSNDEIAKTNGDDSFSESASTDSLTSSKMWQNQTKNGYQEKYSEQLTTPVIINKNFNKNIANSNSKFSNSKMTSTNDNLKNFNNTSSDKYNTKNETQQLLGTMKNSNVKKNMKQFYKYKEVEKHDAKLSLNAKDTLRQDQNGNKPPTPQWVKNNTVKYLQGGNQTTLEAGAEKNCRSCGKVVFQMEQIKAERNIWHKNCFRCKECNKQLNVDTYQSHESLLYCKPHFKALFAPKVVADEVDDGPKRKPELIIRENQPIELPADVIRSSAKQDLGLEELQSLNVKSRFQVFENYQEDHETSSTLDRSPSSGVQRSASMMSKLAKFHAKGMDVGVSDDILNGVTLEEDSNDEVASESDDGDDGDEDIELIRARRAAQKERPISLNNMNDIKSRFEAGSVLSREERREERKQEIQSIRSRLFMGKQAKIKEMYQQAVADSEQGIVAAGKKSEIDLGDKAKSLKEKFERGEIFNNEENGNGQNGENGETNGVHSSKHQQEDSAVFEQSYSKKSRSIFLELDAAAAANTIIPQRSNSTTPRTPEVRKLNHSLLQQQQPENYIKSEDKMEDVVIETAAVSSKFKFFETYKPSEKEKRTFRITPPRDGVVKLPSPDKEIYRDPEIIRSDSKAIDMDDPGVAEQSHTTSKVLSLFRQMEQDQRHPVNDGLKPLKRFTPPPDAGRRVYDESDEEKNVTDSEEEESEDEEDEEEETDEEKPRAAYDDEFIKAAKSAARAKQLRDKFEKWEKNEIEREQNNSSINLCEPADMEYASQVESAKSLRAKFESLRDSGSQIQRDSSRAKVNRFV